MTENEEITEKFDAFLKKFDVKMDALTKRIETLENPPDTGGEGDKPEDKTDAAKTAEDVLRDKLDGFLSKEKLDAMGLIELSQTFAHVKKALENPQSGGTINPPHGSGNSSAKMDAFSKAFGDKNAAAEVIFE